MECSDSESDTDESEIPKMALTSAWEQSITVFNYALQTNNIELLDIMNKAKVILKKEKIKQIVNNKKQFQKNS